MVTFFTKISPDATILVTWAVTVLLGGGVRVTFHLVDCVAFT